MNQDQCYTDFISRKLRFQSGAGLNVHLRDYGLFPHQRDLVSWALRRGRSAIFADTGLGKSRMQVAWADTVSRETGGDVLILAPLAVAEQTVEEGASIGVTVTHARDGADIRPGINITNYARLHRFDFSRFVGVVLDESSVIKHHNSKTLAMLLDAFERTPFKLCATATPAPNDWTELGTHAQFLGVRTQAEMLAEFFVHDGGDTQTWRIKGHAKHLFWRWVASWGALVRSPADLGHDASRYKLPPLEVTQHTVAGGLQAADGMLFALEASSLSERREARKASLASRVAECAELVASEPDQDWIVWVELNDEADAILKAIPGAVEVRGSDDDETKEDAVAWFVGKKCLCGDVQWKKRLTNKNTTSGIEINESHSLSSIRNRTQTNESGISQRITQQTEKNTSSPTSKKPSAIASDAKSTHRAQKRESGQKEMSRTTTPETQKFDSTSESKNTGSQAPTISECLANKAESAQFAEAATQETQDDIGFTSTIATKLEPSVDCSVHPAISGLESSGTLLNCSKMQQCTCGHRKGGRVLISKPRMFGYGLNLQNCARMAFVGVTDSFEAYYQAVRRCWRFGQTRPVHVHVFASEHEGAVVANLARKEADAKAMAESLSAETLEAVRAEVLGYAREHNEYSPASRMAIPSFLKVTA